MEHEHYLKKYILFNWASKSIFYFAYFFTQRGLMGVCMALNENQITLCMIVLVRDPKVKWSVQPDSVIKTVAGVICEFVVDVAAICISARSCGQIFFVIRSKLRTSHARKCNKSLPVWFYDRDIASWLSVVNVMKEDAVETYT